jgi:hypothetical protein
MRRKVAPMGEPASVEDDYLLTMFRDLWPARCCSKLRKGIVKHFRAMA